MHIIYAIIHMRKYSSVQHKTNTTTKLCLNIRLFGVDYRSVDISQAETIFVEFSL